MIVRFQRCNQPGPPHPIPRPGSGSKTVGGMTAVRGRPRELVMSIKCDVIFQWTATPDQREPPAWGVSWQWSNCSWNRVLGAAFRGVAPDQKQ